MNIKEILEDLLKRGEVDEHALGIDEELFTEDWHDIDDVGEKLVRLTSGQLNILHRAREMLQREKHKTIQSILLALDGMIKNKKLGELGCLLQSDQFQGKPLERIKIAIENEGVELRDIVFSVLHPKHLDDLHDILSRVPA